MKVQTLATLFAICFEIALCEEKFICESVYVCKALKDSPSNAILSPLSINIAFGMLYIGAKGESKNQIKKAMFNTLSEGQVLNGFSSLSDVFNARHSGYNITLANRAYAKANYPLLESYTNTLRTKFSSDIVSVNEFNSATVNQINGWVAEKTDDKIQNLVKPSHVNNRTRLILVNALHLKAKWETKFSEAFTQDQLFYSHPTKTANVKMMHMFKKPYQYMANEKVQVMGMNFKSSQDGPKLTMFFILPKERYGLNDFFSGTENFNGLVALIHQARNYTVLTKVDIPKFKVEFELDLSKTMPAAGIKDVFDDKKADLSAIAGKKGDLYVSAAVHKAFIEIDEIGVEAAAATAVIVTELTSGGRYTGPEVEFIADHPFLFAIVDTRSYTALFLGKYLGN